MTISRVITGDLKVTGRYRGRVGCDVLTGWEHGAIRTVNDEIDRDCAGNPIYPLGARLDNPPYPTRFFDTLTGANGLLQAGGRQWDRAITYRRNSGEPIAMEEWVRIADLAITANSFDSFSTARGDIAKKVRDL